VSRKPNLLFIFTDEQRLDSMACYGSPWIQTPSLNALAAGSFVVDNPYVSQPVCTPSRSTIMTGQYPHTNGCTANNIPLRPDTRTIAEMVSDEYVCGYYGKWHLGDEIIPQHGFDRWVSIEDAYRAHYSKTEYLSRFSDYHHFLIENGLTPDTESHGAVVFDRTTAARLAEEFTKASFLGDRAAEFIRRQDEGPFVLYVNFLEPHMPFTGPFDDLYDPDALPVGPHFLQPPAENASLRNRKRAEHYMGGAFGGVDLTNESGWRTVRARYFGLVTLLDRAVGKMLRALDEAGKADNTIVVFTSDHGDMMGDHGILTKGVMYEESVRVPLLIRVPRIARREAHIPGRMSQIDLVPTLLDLMGEDIPPECQGASRRAVLEGRDTLEGNDVFIEWHGAEGFKAAPMDTADDEGNRIKGGPWRTVVSAEGWKLNASPVDRCELFDLNSDPHEMSNLFEEPAQQDRIKDLRDRIRVWQQRTGDTTPF